MARELSYNKQSYYSKGFLCSNQGRAAVKMYFEKSSYISGQSAKLIVQINNTQCGSMMKHIVCSLVQILRIQLPEGGHQQKKEINHKKVICKKQLKDVRDSEKSCQIVGIKLDQQEAPPSTCGFKIFNQYVLQFEAKMGGLLNKTNIAMEIYLQVHPKEIFNKQAAFQTKDWNPLTSKEKEFVVKPLLKMDTSIEDINVSHYNSQSTLSSQKSNNQQKKFKHYMGTQRNKQTFGNYIGKQKTRNKMRHSSKGSKNERDYWNDKRDKGLNKSILDTSINSNIPFNNFKTSPLLTLSKEVSPNISISRNNVTDYFSPMKIKRENKKTTQTYVEEDLHGSQFSTGLKSLKP